ncbi:MAG: leucyl aminopeptidase [Desulfitobacteriaceae bacterium]
MNIVLNKAKDNVECKIYQVYEKGDLKALPLEIRSNLELLISKGLFKGGAEELFCLTSEQNNNLKQIILIGLGTEDSLTKEKIRVASAKALKKAMELKTKNVDLFLPNPSPINISDLFKATVEGLLLSTYKFSKYKSANIDNIIDEINILNLPEESVEALAKISEETKTIIAGTLMARDLVNEPANVLNPIALAEKAKAVGKATNIEIEIFDEPAIKRLDMKAYLAVAQGSLNPPRLIVMRYFADKENKDNILGLVGKGLTYDSGGYSIKPTDSMLTMKNDMAGAAAVIGAMSSIAKMKLKVNVVAVIASCENMISGNAYRPGDIIGSMGGKTIEIISTDAEGRLTLVDAMHYIIDKEKASKVIDIATLTGAIRIALGINVTGVVTNNSNFYHELEKASQLSGERIWQLPSFDEYQKLIKSDIADLKNTGGKYAGSITAGMFIGEFVQEKPWLHLDIAGTSWSEQDSEYFSKGGTGVGVSTLYYLARNMVK